MDNYNDSRVLSQTVDDVDAACDLNETIYSWLDSIKDIHCASVEDYKVLNGTIDRFISEVNVAIHPLEDGKFTKYVVAKDVLNLLIEKKKSLKNLFRECVSVKPANNDSGISMDDVDIIPVENVNVSTKSGVTTVYPLSTAMRLLGFNILKPEQEAVIDAALSKKDCLAVMPTGFGKSACFLLPGLIELGLTIVISPLKALMYDQINYLNSIGIKASYGCVASDANSSVFFNSLTQRTPDVKFIFYTPEKIVSALSEVGDNNKLRRILTSLYKRGLLLRFVVDEAHCIRLWGTDFRIDYGMLGVIRKLFPNVPFMALTGTATPATQLLICNSLSLQDPFKSINSCVRNNLKIEVVKKSSSTKNLEILICKITAIDQYACGIVYCSSRKECESLALLLVKAGYTAAPYHAGLSDVERDDYQQQWMSGHCKIMCATNAFGMGVNKPNVRLVVHLTMPTSISSYYQECGRAGRDGLVASCVLFYQFNDHCYQKHLIDEKKNEGTRDFETKELWEMVDYCENVFECRNSIIARHFGEEPVVCVEGGIAKCDNCAAQKVEAKVFVSEEVDWICALFNQNPNVFYTFTDLVKVFLTAKKEKSFKNKWKSANVKYFVRRLIIDGILEEKVVSNQYTDLKTGIKCWKYSGFLRFGCRWPVSEYAVSLIEEAAAPKNKKIRLEVNSDSDFED